MLGLFDAVEGLGDRLVLLLDLLFRPVDTTLCRNEPGAHRLLLVQLVERLLAALDLRMVVAQHALERLQLLLQVLPLGSHVLDTWLLILVSHVAMRRP